MSLIRKIAKQELLREEAGISFIVRKWAKILKQEVEDQLKEHKEAELAKIKAKGTQTQTPKKPSSQLELNFSQNDKEKEEYLELTDPFGLGPEDDNDKFNDPFYWEDETGSGKGTKNNDYDNWDDYDDWEESYWRHRKGWRNRDGGYYKKKKGNLGYPESYGSGYDYGGYGNYKPAPYIPPLEEISVFGENWPEEYKEFSVDMWVLKNSSRIEYDHYKSGYSDSGEYIVYLNVPLSSMSESTFIHEIKHAYDDWNRMRHGGKPIRDTWEIKNIYTKDFEKLILGGSTMYPQLGSIIRNFYLGSKLEAPAYLENEYDNSMVDYEDVGRKMMNFKATNYLDKRGNPTKGLEAEFERVKKQDIPLFKKFKSVVDFIYWVEKYFNKRGRDIFKRVAKMRYVHNRPKPKYTATTYKPSTYKGTSSYKPVEKDDHEIGDWVYTPEKGWHEKEEKSLADLEKKYGVNQSEFEEGESIGGWKYSKERGWYFDPSDEDNDMPY